MPVGLELLIIALNGDSLAMGSTTHYPATVLNWLESCAKAVEMENPRRWGVYSYLYLNRFPHTCKNC